MSDWTEKELKYIVYLNELIDKYNSVQTYKKYKVKNINERPKNTMFAAFSKPLGGCRYGFIKASTKLNYIVRISHSNIDYITEFNEHLYVKKSIAKPFLENPNFYLVQNVKIKIPELSVKKNVEYYEFQFRDFEEKENDCLGFTEYFLTGEWKDGQCPLKSKYLDYDKYKTDKPFTQETFKVADDAPKFESNCEGFFGNTDSHNLRIALLTKKHYGDCINRCADPEVGDAISIIYTQWYKKETKGQTPYHVAPVIAKDGCWVVTCEADAGDEKRERPQFDIYSTDPDDKQSFWDTHKSHYGGATSISIVLENTE